jgi:uncharacterized protein
MQRQVMWQAIDTVGMEHCTVRAGESEVVIDGLVLAVVEGAPHRLAYTVTCDGAWRTREVVARVLPHGPTLTLLADGHGSWRDGTGQALPALDGCTDVDITVTPSTNTLPIRRLGLVPGQSAMIRVVYVVAPTLMLEPGEQRYTRLSMSSYRFEALGSDFQAKLAVDADGLVVTYPGLFTRVWPAIDSDATHN